MTSLDAPSESHRLWLSADTVVELRDVLDSLNYAYNSVSYLDALIADERAYYLASIFEYPQSPWVYEDYDVYYRHPGSRPRHADVHHFFWRQIVSEGLLPTSELQIMSLRLSSPGILEIIGHLSPLETVRKWLIDRDERRRNRLYRDRVEEEQLYVETERQRLENERLRNEVLRERLDILREQGLPTSVIPRIINTTLLGPLDELGEHVDRGALLPRPPEQEDDVPLDGEDS